MIHMAMVIACAALLAAASASAQTTRPAIDDRSAIEQAARDYMEGWYTADVTRMTRALHPELVKRFFESQPDGTRILRTMGKEQMVAWTEGGGGSRLPTPMRAITVQVLDSSGDIASAKATSLEYTDYLQLARVDGRWVIVNVLWRINPPPAP